MEPVFPFRVVQVILNSKTMYISTVHLPTAALAPRKQPIALTQSVQLTPATEPRSTRSEYNASKSANSELPATMEGWHPAVMSSRVRQMPIAPLQHSATPACPTSATRLHVMSRAACVCLRVLSRPALQENTASCYAPTPPSS